MKKIIPILTLVLAFGNAWDVKSLNTSATFSNNEKFFEKNLLIAQSLSHEDIQEILGIRQYTQEELAKIKEFQTQQILAIDRNQNIRENPQLYNISKPASELKKQCLAGNDEYCVALGFTYHIGKGIKQDFFEAVKWYQKACGLDNGKGCTFLGNMYDGGRGVEQDDFKAVKWYKKACKLNNGKGCATLGRMYEDGKGVRLNKKIALKYYGKACDLKVQKGCEEYARLKNINCKN